MSRILIIDIETTGFLRSGGEICEVGAAELDLTNGKRKIVFDEIVKPESIFLDETWIVRNGYMKVSEIEQGKDFGEIKEDLQTLIDRYAGVTAYNNQFDFEFLENYGITIDKKLQCPMLLSTNICKLPKRGAAARYGGFKWPSVEEAYRYFFPNSNYVEKHRGADDAMHEAKIVYELYKIGVFDAL